ncbi:F-box protein At1g55000-like [Bidens hawaiensis]|uniref:F-box protein At1g55000-like n=1 Tax=Bidens hawaiensis TaxID=980011 RepID=UPI00404957CA
MGCQGQEEEEEDILEQQTLALTLSSDASAMNSNFEALICKDILRIIFEKLPVADLGRSACVCRLWSSVASDREILVRAFMAPWKLKRLIGNPTSAAFWRYNNSLSRFAISHRLARADTLASLALNYSVQVTDIKRLNNMMSDHGIHSRDRLLIPVSTPDILINGTCYIELDAHAKREVAVLYPQGSPETNVLNKVTSEPGKRRVIDSLRRSMHADDGTAQYYLSISNGDPRAALMEFSEDIRWERQNRLT